MSAMPGPRTPGEGDADVSTDTAEATDVATDSTGQSHIEFIGSDAIEVKRVLVKADQQDFDFNVNLGGSALFSGAQSLGSTGTWEEFVPDQNTKANNNLAAQVEADITSAGSAGDADFVVVYETA